MKTQFPCLSKAQKSTMLFLVIAAFVIASASPCMAHTKKFLYWTDKDFSKIQRLDLSGSTVEDILTAADGLLNPRGLAIDPATDKMYWSDGNNGEIRRANLDGSDSEQLVSGLAYPTDIALDIANSKIYFSEYGTVKIRKVNTDGNGPIEDVIIGTEIPYYLALDLTNSRIYWADLNNTVIRRANIDGTSPEVFIAGLTHVRDIVLDIPGNKIYWGDRGDRTVRRANLSDGSGIEILYGPTGLDRPHGLLLDGDDLYWTDTDMEAVYRGSKDGTAPMEMLASGFDGPWAMAIAEFPHMIYVDASVTPGNGSSWANAFDNLQSALDIAQAADTIKVAGGTYYPGITGLADPREASFQMINGVTIQGGYAGVNGAPIPGARDIQLYETILSGDIGVEGDSTDNVYNVFYHPTGTNLDQTAVLDGVTITSENQYYNSSWPYTFSNGMFNYSSSPTITNCTFTENTNSGITNMDNSNPIITSCTFIQNWSEAGGAIYNFDSSSPTITDSTFTNNSAFVGGAVCNDWNSTSTLTNCTFTDNAAINYGGAMYIAYANPTINNCTFTGNSADRGGGMYNHDHANPTVNNSIIWGNTATSGGNEISLHNTSTIDVDYCDVQGSLAAIYDDGSGNTINWGTSNIDADPMFVSSSDLHLLPFSPCINAGDPDFVYTGQTDIDGQSRVAYSRVDIGADEVFPIAGDFEPDEHVGVLDLYEFASHWLDSGCTAPDFCSGADLQQDSGVDNLDFAVLHRHWLYTTIIADFTKNGRVDLQDFAMLAQYWQQDNTLIDIAPDGSPDGIIDINELLLMANNWLETTP